MQKFERSFEISIRGCDCNHKPEDWPVEFIDSLRRLSLHKQDSLYLIAVEFLIAATNTHDDLHAGDRLDVTRQYAAVAKFNRVMGGRSKLKADASAGDIIRSDLKRKLPRAKTLFSQSRLCFPTPTCTIFGVLPRSTPSSLASAPCGTVFTVIETTLGGATGPSSLGRYFAEIDREAGGPAAMVV